MPGHGLSRRNHQDQDHYHWVKVKAKAGQHQLDGFSNCEIEFSKSVRNLGVFLDESLSMEMQVNQLFYISSFVESVRSVLS